MSGHSKWATIKHQKGAKDKARGKLFAKLIRQVEVAAREGGGDLESNATLRTMYNKARAASVPIDTIERAIKRGTGELEGVTYEAITYEGYAPCGVAVLVDVLTDNRNRAGLRGAQRVRQDGRLDGRAGLGVVAVQPAGRRAGARPGRRGRRDAGRPRRRRRRRHRRRRHVDDHLRAGQGRGRSARRSRPPASRSSRPRRRWSPRPRSPSTPREDAKKVLRVIDALEDNDDVQDVYSNFDIPESILEAGGRLRWASASAIPPPTSRCPAPAGAATPGRLPRPARRARLLPGRRHAGVHQAAHQLHRRHRRVRRASARRCWPSARSRSRATSASPRSTA